MKKVHKNYAITMAIPEFCGAQNKVFNCDFDTIYFFCLLIHNVMHGNCCIKKVINKSHQNINRLQITTFLLITFLGIVYI